MSAAFDLMMEGQIFQAILTPFIVTIGAELFFGMIFLTGLALIYMKTKSTGLVSIVIMCVSISVLPFVPAPIQIYLIILLALSVSYMIYQLYVG